MTPNPHLFRNIPPRKTPTKSKICIFKHNHDKILDSPLYYQKYPLKRVNSSTEGGFEDWSHQLQWRHCPEHFSSKSNILFNPINIHWISFPPSTTFYYLRFEINWITIDNWEDNFFCHPQKATHFQLGCIDRSWP